MGHRGHSDLDPLEEAGEQKGGDASRGLAWRVVVFGGGVGLAWNACAPHVYQSRLSLVPFELDLAPFYPPRSCGAEGEWMKGLRV